MRRHRPSVFRFVFWMGVPIFSMFFLAEWLHRDHVLSASHALTAGILGIIGAAALSYHKARLFLP